MVFMFVFTQYANIVSIDQDLMYYIQSHSVLTYLGIPDGIL